MSNTMCYFSNLIAIENFYCINRNFLMENGPKKKICHCISYLTRAIFIGALIFDIITASDPYMRAFQVILIIEMIQLIVNAVYRRKTFAAITRLDSKCGINDAYFEAISLKIRKVATISVVSAVLDVIGLYLLEIRVPVIITLVILFSALDTELVFFALLVECVNLRLSTVKDQQPYAGCRIYRHILVIAAYINEEYTPGVLLMLGTTILTTVIYSFLIFLAQPNMIWGTSIYLFWREMKSVHSLWLLCSAAAETERLRRRLTFHLASRLALDPTISKERNPTLHKTVRRWYSTVLSLRPCYFSGTILVFGLAVPLNVIDTSISYMLIIIQIYVAYK